MGAADADQINASSPLRKSRSSVRVCGIDNALLRFGDYPHTIDDMAGCLARVDRLAGDVRDKVRGLNARRIFGL